LCTRIVNAIESEGPISFARYMEMALYEPGLGYYVNGLQRFGAGGDFVTAPEHGALFARSLARALDRMAGELDADWTLLELGPGSGVLARDLLFALEQPPARYLMLEPSAALRQVQQETLSELPTRLAKRLEWIDAPPSERFEGALIGNEVVDALPVRRFRIAGDGVEEGRVAWRGQGFEWNWIDADQHLRESVERIQDGLDRPLEPEYTSEVVPHLPEWLRTVTDPIARGIALMIDYGYPGREYYHPSRSSGTLVCHYRHRAHFDPFVWPGLTDLSAFVDFSALAAGAHRCEMDVAGFTSQAGFVLGSGVGEELVQVDDEIERVRLTAELKRLVLPGEMGERFKVMALTRDFDPPLPEFDLSDQLTRL